MTASWKPRRPSCGTRDAQVSSALSRRGPRSRLFCLTALLILPSCGRSDASRIRQALQDQFPDGVRRCLGLSSDTVGIHVSGPSGVLYYPSTGPTASLRHPFVFYSANATEPVPELVQRLSDQGILRRAVVDATTDLERETEQVVSAGDGSIRRNVKVYNHERHVFPVVIYTTAAQDDRFLYETRLPGTIDSLSAPNFPSRMYDNPLPSPDHHYDLPVVEPYALSVTTGACFPETIERIDDIRTSRDWGGQEIIQAEITLAQHPLVWMRTAAFSRVALGPATESIYEPRRATASFRITDGRLTYLNGIDQP